MSFSEAINDMEEDKSDFPMLLDSGDLRLLVSYSNQYLTWLGSSSSLSLVSPVWNKILNPPFPKLVSQEGGDEDMQHKQIDFSEDSGEALLILLRIAHCQFKKLPSTLDYETIVELAILCDKYDCVGLVKPWLASWLVNEETEYKKPGHEDWLFIAWAFGKEKIFEELAPRLLEEMSINDKGEAMTSAGGILQFSVIPEMIENMMTIRQATIKDLLEVTYDYFDKSLRDDVITFGQPDKKSSAIMCGSLLIGLNAIGLWPQKSSDDINISVQDLASKLKSLRVWTNPGIRNSYFHYDWDLVKFSSGIDSVLSSMPDPVLESHRRHMRIQAMK